MTTAAYTSQQLSSYYKQAVSAVFRPQDDVVLVALQYDLSNFGTNIVLKFAANGSQLTPLTWQPHALLPGYNLSYLFNMDIDSTDGSVFVTGSIQGALPETNMTRTQNLQMYRIAANNSFIWSSIHVVASQYTVVSKVAVNRL